jgi:hypothetical protein
MPGATMITRVRSPLRLRHVMRATPDSKRYTDSGACFSSKMMPCLPTRLMVRALASLCSWRDVSQEMFLSPRNLRIPDFPTARMASVYQTAPDGEVPVQRAWFSMRPIRSAARWCWSSHRDGVGFATRREKPGMPSSVYSVLRRTKCSNKSEQRVELEERTAETQVVEIDIGIESEFDPAQRRDPPPAFDRVPLDQRKALQTKAWVRSYESASHPFHPEHHSHDRDRWSSDPQRVLWSALNYPRKRHLGRRRDRRRPRSTGGFGGRASTCRRSHRRCCGRRHRNANQNSLQDSESRHHYSSQETE